MRMSKEKAEAIQKLYDGLISDLTAMNGKPCDVVLLIHPQHGDEEDDCEGMTLHSNADPLQAHKLAFSCFMWAEANMDNYHNMMEPAPDGAKLN